MKPLLVLNLFAVSLFIGMFSLLVLSQRLQYKHKFFDKAFRHASSDTYFAFLLGAALLSGLPPMLEPAVIGEVMQMTLGPMSLMTVMPSGYAAGAALTFGLWYVVCIGALIFSSGTALTVLAERLSQLKTPKVPAPSTNVRSFSR